MEWDVVDVQPMLLMALQVRRRYGGSGDLDLAPERDVWQIKSRENGFYGNALKKTGLN